MGFHLNNSPDLSMAEITSQLFNNKFLSDIQFLVEGKTMYGHSFELMKRSRVFHLELFGTRYDNKLIPVDESISYAAFYQFLRFIYQDECDFSVEIGRDVLKLAIKYKVIKLENQAIQFMMAPELRLSFFEFSVMEDYHLVSKSSPVMLGLDLSKHISSEEFLALSSNVIEKILSVRIIENDISEDKIFEGLMEWINHNCAQNEIPLTDRRQHFDKLIRLIRFGSMTLEEFRKCVAKHNYLFTDHDISTIFREIAVPNLNERNWISEPRIPTKSFSLQNYYFAVKFETKFKVTVELKLVGIWYGHSWPHFPCEITIRSDHNDDTNVLDLWKFNGGVSQGKHAMFLSLGDCIRVKPNSMYFIDFKFNTHTFRYFNVLSVDDGVQLNAATGLSAKSEVQQNVTVIEKSKNMFQMIFENVND